LLHRDGQRKMLTGRYRTTVIKAENLPRRCCDRYLKNDRYRAAVVIIYVHWNL
jgi:hypothetical protein